MISLIDNKYNIILASQSPRRKQLLSDLGIDFQVRLKKGIDEQFPESMPVADVAQYLSKKKFDAYLGEIQPKELIITADTVVIQNGCIIGKPKDKAHAKEMLRSLSANTHVVNTGVTLGTAKENKSFNSITNVTFTKLTDAEIDYYIEHFKPFDKAGSYGIQEWIGYVGIESIEGSFYNVMGLPVQQLYRQLLKF